MRELFVELLQVALGTRERLSRVPNIYEWHSLLEEAEKHAIVAVLLCGLERLPVEQLPPVPLKLQWIGKARIIEEKNRAFTNSCAEVVGQLEKDGFKCCVLKGQANHRYYPKEMGLRRSSGDIDVWTVPDGMDSEEGKAKSGAAHPVRRTLEYVEREHELTGLCWLHCNFNHREGVPVEVHFRPSFMNEPCKNRRFLKHFADIEKCVKREKIDGVELPVMKVEEDVVYQMNHIYRHLIDEGVGLRQIVDYYFLLKTFENELSQMENEFPMKKKEVMKTVEWLGMKRLAGALMYVMKEVFGMRNEALLCEPNEKEGKFLLSEIMTAGNFGHSDPRMDELNTSSTFKRQVSQAWRRFKRNMRFVANYPGEVIWEPFARMYHFSWKKIIIWKWLADKSVSKEEGK